MIAAACFLHVRNPNVFPMAFQAGKSKFLWKNLTGI